MRDQLPAGRWASINALFEEEMERPSGERESFLRGACGDDRQLRDEVLQLLACDTQEESDLLSALQSQAASVVAEEPGAGSMPGPWRIEREIGRGVGLCPHNGVANPAQDAIIPHGAQRTH